MTTILLVEDEKSLSEPLAYLLRREGYEVSIVDNGPAALEMVDQSPPDLMLLDLMLPGLAGTEVCREVRTKSSLPIIMLTAKDSEIDIVVGLELGADDYVTKPFSPRELVARAKAVLRRVRPALAGEALRFGDVEMDTVAHKVKRGGKQVPLGPTEYRLLKHFLEYPGHVFSRERLLDSVWGHDSDIEIRTVDVHIRRLRKALNEGFDSDIIRTVRSAGYSLDQDAV